MTHEETLIWEKLRRGTILLTSATDTLKYLSFEKLTAPGVARVADVSNNVTFVQGMLELLAADLAAGRFPFREYQVSTPRRQGSWD